MEALLEDKTSFSEFDANVVSLLDLLTSVISVSAVPGGPVLFEASSETSRDLLRPKGLFVVSLFSGVFFLCCFTSGLNLLEF